MKGKIKYYNEERSFGFILGEDAEDYYFYIKSTNEPLQIKKGLFVQFDPIIGKKDKLEAINIFIDNVQKNSINQRKSNKTITINGETILVSSILSYQLETRRPEYEYIDIFNESGNWGYESYCSDKHSDGYDTHGEDYWHISDYLDCIDTYIENNFDYWSGGSVSSFDEYKYLEDLEEYNENRAKYFINIKFKNGKNRNFFIDEYKVPYEVIWDEEYQVSEDAYDGCTPSIFDKYHEVYDSVYTNPDEDHEYAIRFPKLVYTEEYNDNNEIYKEAMQIIKDIDQLLL